MKKLIWFLGFAVLLIAVLFATNSSQITQISPISQIPLISHITLNSPIPPNTLTEVRVTKVFDGDTIEIETGQKVRYIGMDAMEVYPAVGCFSLEAKKENENLVLGKMVKLEKDVSETDKYGRLLRYVYVGNIFVNDELTKEGYAKIMTVPPDVKYKDEFLQSEKYAKENNLGLWLKCF